MKATYKQIQSWVKQNYGFVPKTCWIAHVKNMCGLPMRNAPNRLGEDLVNPCPQGKIEPIKAAFRYFKMIN
jgi:hypothetical protein